MDKNRASVDYATFKFLYRKYREFGIPLMVILVCTALLIMVLVPQFQNLLELSRKAKESEKNLEVLRKNFDVLSSLNDSLLTSQLRIVSLALPVNKDFIGIINAISYASSVAGVGVSDFQLSVGELSKNGASLSDSLGTSVTLSVDADFEGVNRFMNTLTNTLPLSEVTSISTGDFSSSLTVNFHNIPFPSTISQGISPIVSLSSDDLNLINQLANFSYVASYEFSVLEEGTPSSDLSENF